MITIKIKSKKHCSNPKWFGEAIWLNKHKADIIISEAKNTNSGEFALTVLHELLHIWLSILMFNGFKVKNEHKFIYLVEEDIKTRFKQVIKGKL
jgi:hypothetical protein